MMDLYLRVGSVTDKDVMLEVESYIIAFALHCFDHQPVKVHYYMEVLEVTPLIHCCPAILDGWTKTDRPDSIVCTQKCPVTLVSKSERLTVLGLCSILRATLYKSSTKDSSNIASKLLGFRQGCLMAPAEASVWTQFCEVDMPDALKAILEWHGDRWSIPIALLRFDVHLSLPARIHNVRKRAQELSLCDSSPSTNVLGLSDNLHTYAEGPDMVLSDLILFSLFSVFRNLCGTDILNQNIPRVMEWYRKCVQVEPKFNKVSEMVLKVKKLKFSKVEIPTFEEQSIYKRDPRRYKPSNRIFTRQEDVDQVLGMFPIDVMIPYTEKEEKGYQLEWNSLSRHITPHDYLPTKRLERKMQQLENMVSAVMNLCQPGSIIVDFCSGGGHLGIILAALLPSNTVILVENKEESLKRARQRAMSAHIRNLDFYQSNLDYFDRPFDIGMALHACGMASDLVLQKCISHQASFVICPCCYGSVSPANSAVYPQSQKFKRYISGSEYIVLAHSADQTHDEEHPKTLQGRLCMQAVDSDRLFSAEELGYAVQLSRMTPPGSSPKDHVLVGIFSKL
ncbi:unnamed protein product [Darwinula stevensoni]|uniref:Methyltransferase domain-containing protein n=1 Tax=Darwinula stevensoni TaxID=69355 RepID=A0A7R8X798_9CRUS|nr:unnamed protein product [Darwinula stevensoni]CAG0886741.1 unnamed protein product [Darwinula stevensoni]